jgi:hypothetical protein
MKKNLFLLCLFCLASWAPAVPSTVFSGWVRHNTFLNYPTRAAVSKADGYIYMVGHTDTASQVDAFFAKFNPTNGSLAYTQKFGAICPSGCGNNNNYYEDIVNDFVDYGGDLIMTGVGSTASIQKRCTVWRFTPSGTLVWGTVFTGIMT